MFFFCKLSNVNIFRSTAVHTEKATLGGALLFQGPTTRANQPLPDSMTPPQNSFALRESNKFYPPHHA
jgi:hypothetical protein